MKWKKKEKKEKNDMKIWNKLWIIKSRGYKIKNKILPYDVITFQNSKMYWLEFISNLRISSMLILTYFKPVIFLYLLKISESSGFLIFEGVRKRTLAKLD